MKDILKYYEENKEILDQPHSISYVYHQNETIKAKIVVGCNPYELTIGLLDLTEGRVNYLLLDKDLKIYQDTNPTGRRNEIYDLFNGKENFFIPSNCLGVLEKDIIQFQNNCNREQKMR